MRSCWLRSGVVGAGVLALLPGSILPAQANAQAAERFRVMVTNLMPGEDTDDDFGKDLAKELRKLINELPTHEPVEEDEIKDAVKKFDLDMEDLDCIKSLQLAGQINARVVFCGDYTENRDDKTFALRGISFAVPGGPAFDIADKIWGEREAEVAAREIFQSFETYVDQLRRATFCGDYFNSKDWSGAEENCTLALEMNPDDVQVRHVYAMLLRELERNEEAYEEAKRVISLDPLHDQALQLAGYLAAILDYPEEARNYYTQYLQLNPGNAAVRMNIAYELATAGAPEGAMLLIEEGLAIEPDNVDLLLQHASFANRAGQDLKEAAPDGTLSPEIANLYRKARESYDKVYQVRGETMESAHLRNMIASYVELGEIEEAIVMAQRALETHPDEPQLWSLYADVLKRSDRLDEAIMALDELEGRDPGYQNVKVRQGNWRVEAGREEEALPFLQEAVEKGEQTADVIARMLFATGHGRGIAPDQKNWSYALELIQMAKTFQAEVSEMVAGELDFWHGYVLYNQGLEQEKPQTLRTAQLTLPKFQQAARFFAMPRVVAYAETQPTIPLQRFRDNTQQYIEIQEAIIQRGN